MLALRDRLGSDHGALHNDLLPKLRGKACGGKNISLLAPVETPRGEDRARSQDFLYGNDGMPE
jgi:hypothetical protein